MPSPKWDIYNTTLHLRLREHNRRRGRKILSKNQMTKTVSSGHDRMLLREENPFSSGMNPDRLPKQ